MFCEKTNFENGVYRKIVSKSIYCCWREVLLIDVLLQSLSDADSGKRDLDIIPKRTAPG